MAIHEHSTSTTTAKRLTRGGAALLLAGSLAACDSHKDKSPDLCESPRAVSKLFPGDPAATADRGTWKNGIIINTTVPVGANGIVVGYRGSIADPWQDSRAISPENAQTVAVLLGNRAVSFSTYTTAEKGSAACTAIPPSLFSEPQPLNQPIIDGATLPEWPPHTS